MKKQNWLLLAILLVMVPVWQGCDDDGYSIGDRGIDLVTVRNPTSGAYYLEGDTWGTICPISTHIPWFRPVDGKRAFVLFNPLYDNYQGYDVAVQLEGVREILTKPVEELTAENEEEYGNDPVTIFQGNMWISGGYLNIIFRQYLPVKEPHRVSLVRNKTVEPEDDGYIHLEYRYNTYDDQTKYFTDGAMVSFSLKSLEDEITAETKGIKVKLNSEKNGEVEVAFDIKNQNPSETLKKITNEDIEKAKIE